MRSRAVVVIAALALLTTACSFRLISIPGEGPTRYRDEIFSEVSVTTDLVYGSAVDQQGQPVTLRLDLYQPTGDTVTSRPAIVFVHGGGFRQGDKTSPEIVDEARTFAKKGYLTVSINYRLSATGCVPTIDAACLTAIQHAKYDAQAAVRWLRANAATYGIDDERIAVGGSSAGAITALNVAYGSEDLGPGGSNPGHPSTVKAAVSLSGTRALNNPNPGEPAALLFHGTDDLLVPYASAVSTRDAALAVGLIAELTAWEDAGHVPYVQHRAEIITQTTNFLYWTMALKLAAT